MTDEKETSVRAKCLRKKYMGVWKQESSLMSRGWARPQNRGQVHAQEQDKEHALLLWKGGEPQEEELGHIAVVLPPHAILISAGNE